MKITKIPGLGSFGVFIDGVDFNNLSREEWIEIGKIHLKNLVTIIRKTSLTQSTLVGRVLDFGEPRYNLKNMMVKKYNMPFDVIVTLAETNDSLLDTVDADAVNALYNTQEKTQTGYDVSKVAGGYDKQGRPKGLFAEGELQWHSNESGTLTWTPGVALLGAKGVKGSATCFMTTADWYQDQSESFRSELDDMVITHRFTPGKINPGLNKQHDAIMQANMCPKEQDIPMIIQSPGGIKGLHYSINTVSQVKGMTQKESNKLFAKLNKELFVEKYQYDHWYKNNGDLLLFDNSITLHRRLGKTDGRLCYRVAHDYTNLQDGAYQPYFMTKYQKQYNQEIRTLIKISGIKNFKLPDQCLLDRIKNVFN
jgi:alpha-ketoglutarate-dependent taurine dioxygenase